MVLRWMRRGWPVLVCVFAATSVTTRPKPGLEGWHLVVLVATTVFAASVIGMRLTLLRADAHFTPVVALIGLSSVAVMVAQPNGAGSIGLLMAVLFYTRRLPDRVALPVSVVAFVVLAVVSELTGHGPGPALLAVLVGFYWMTFLGNRASEANAQALDLLQALEQSRVAEARAVTLAERQRLAREMHDVLAHSLSGLMLQLEGARMLAAESPADPRLPGVIDRAHQLAKSGLEESRRAIGMLRDDDLPGPEGLAALVRGFEEDRGVPCRLTVTGEPKELTSEARLALYRVAQEALTNIAKHAQPHLVELHLVYDAGVTRLTVEDFSTANGVTPSSVPGGGYGLTGMRERAELLGGSLTATPTESGFRVELDVPV
jgi:signal transduction histidine kinase